MIFITVSSQMSGTYQSILKEAKSLGLDEQRLAVVDSKMNSGAQGLLVMKAAEMAKKGASKEKILESLKKSIPKTQIYVCLNTIEYAAKGGGFPIQWAALEWPLRFGPLCPLTGKEKGPLSAWVSPRNT
jgi:fatty acid-binding protein DegV